MANNHSKVSIEYNRRQDNIMLRPSKEIGQRIRAAAKAAGQSVQGYVVQAALDRIARETHDEDPG